MEDKIRDAYKNHQREPDWNRMLMAGGAGAIGQGAFAGAIGTPTVATYTSASSVTA